MIFLVILPHYVALASITGSVKSAQRRQRLVAASTFFGTALLRRKAAEMGPAIRYTLKTACVRKI